MKKNSGFLILALSLYSILLFSSIGMANSQKMVIKVGSVNNTNHPVPQALINIFKPRVEELSGGNIEVKIFENGVLGEEPAMIEQVQLGIIQMVSTGGPLSVFYPKVDILNLPYIFKNTDEADRIIRGEYGKRIMEDLPEIGLRGLTYFENGFRVTTNSVRPINNLSDIKGLKIRTPNSKAQINIFSALGANVTPLAFGELFSALQQGVVDGQENGYNTIASQSYYEVQKYLTVTNHMYGTFILVVGDKWWNSLTEEQQKIIQTAADETSNFEFKLSREEEMKNKQICIEKGMLITTPDLDEFAQAVHSVYEDFYQKYPEFKTLVEEILTAKKY